MKKILSYGGGADSFAMLLDALDRGERPDAAVFADVGSAKGDDGEWPDTYRHIREHAMPICEKAGIAFYWITTEGYPIRGHESLLAYFEAKRLMPSRLSRLCTSAAKVERIAAFLGDQFPDEQFEVWVGFEAGEEIRAENDPHGTVRSADGRKNRFPLMERGLCRCRAVALIQQHGLPVPRKSACVYCPFGTRGDFQTLARELPATFDRVARMEENCRTTKSGKIMRFGYQKGDGTDPTLAEWIAKPYAGRKISCKVCGAAERATKAAGCGYL